MARAAALAVVVALLGSCARRAADEGRDAQLQVAGAQFVREPLPPDGPGPGVRNVSISPIVRPGATGRRCAGEVEPAATGVALSLAGDVGYWVLPAGLPDVAAPGFPTFAAEVGFARTLAEGERTLLVRAVDGDGRFGATLARALTVAADRPQGKLVVSLAWGNAADLDLHVVDPAGVEIFHRDIHSHVPPPPGSPPEPPGASHDGGILDFDSNAQCVLDGQRAENVVWADDPPRGRYLVRVGTSSLCGEVNARWRVTVALDGQVVAGAEGVSTDADLRFPAKRGGGVLAVEFDVP